MGSFILFCSIRFGRCNGGRLSSTSEIMRFHLSQKAMRKLVHLSLKMVKLMDHLGHLLMEEPTVLTLSG